MELSKRMKAVAQMVPAGHIAADVGCDHGFVSIYLVRQGICPHVYAADVRPGPLARAKAHAEESGLTAYITPVLSDGLKEVPVGSVDMCGEMTGADVMIAAGMGGRLTVRILSDVPEKTEQLSCVVLEPQSEVWLVRRWLSENGFVIVDEDMVFEDGKFYPVIKAKNARRPEADTAAEAGSGEENGYAFSTAGQSSQSLSGDSELDRANAEMAALHMQMAAAGLSEERCQAACECFGPVLMGQKSAVLLSFLEHTIEKDGGLLRELPDAPDDPEKARRIEDRRKALRERIELAEKIAAMLRVERSRK